METFNLSVKVGSYFSWTKLNNLLWRQNYKTAVSLIWLPIISLFQSFVFVWKSVKLHPDNDGHIGYTVLSVKALPACVANKVVARDLKQ